MKPTKNVPQQGTQIWQIIAELIYDKKIRVWQEWSGQPNYQNFKTVINSNYNTEQSGFDGSMIDILEVFYEDGTRDRIYFPVSYIEFDD